MKWEKFPSCFRWKYNRPTGKYSTLFSETFVWQQSAKTEPKTWNDRMREKLWGCICVVRFQLNHQNEFRQPYIQLVGPLTLPNKVNSFTDGMSDCTEFCTLKKKIALTSKHLSWNIKQKIPSTIKWFENCQILYSWHRTVKVIQTNCKLFVYKLWHNNTTHTN